MIIDNIGNAEIYTKNDEKLRKAFCYLEEYIKNPLEDGKYEIDGVEMYAIVVEAELKEQGRMEAHDKYIDLQFIYKGSEVMRLCNRSLLTTEEDCLEEKDAIFFEPSANANSYIFNEGDFAVFYPDDAHEPCLCYKENKTVKKVVVKIKV